MQNWQITSNIGISLFILITVKMELKGNYLIWWNVPSKLIILYKKLTAHSVIKLIEVSVLHSKLPFFIVYYTGRAINSLDSRIKTLLERQTQTFYSP